MPLKIFLETEFVNILSINVAEWEVRRVGLDISGIKACEDKLSTNSLGGQVTIVLK